MKIDGNARTMRVPMAFRIVWPQATSDNVIVGERFLERRALLNVGFVRRAIFISHVFVHISSVFVRIS